ncbi:hypothetical protein CANARDRAFT_29003, partial [[Candida] arabinofermentans NRRL YB-2248]
MSIKRIPPHEATSITSSSSIFSPVSVIKELIDNAIDALKSVQLPQIYIEVDLVSGGLQHILVRDNGSGVEKQDRPMMCLNCTTSKITSWEELQNNGIETCGFRGEALFFICQLSGSLQIITKTATDEIAECWNVNNKGLPIGSSQKVSARQGTSISVKNLFSSTPVRKSFLKKQSKKTIDGILDLIYAYSITYRDIRFHLKFVKVSPMGQITTEGIDQIFINNLPAIKILNNILKLRQNSTFFEINDSLKTETSFEIRLNAILPRMRAQDELLPKKTLKILSVNDRPLNTKLTLGKTITKMMNDIYSSNKLFAPTIWVLKINIPFEKVDVNIEPEKSDVMIVELDQLIQSLKSLLNKYVMEQHDIGLEPVTEENEPVNHDRDVIVLDRTTDNSVFSPDEKEITVHDETMDDDAFSNILQDKVKQKRDVAIDYLRGLVPTSITNLLSEQSTNNNDKDNDNDNDNANDDDDLLELADPEQPVVSMNHTGSVSHLEKSPALRITNPTVDSTDKDWSFSMSNTNGLSSEPDIPDRNSSSSIGHKDIDNTADISISNPWTISKMANQMRQMKKSTQKSNQSAIPTPETTLIDLNSSIEIPKLASKVVSKTPQTSKPLTQVPVQKGLQFKVLPSVADMSQRTEGDEVEVNYTINENISKRQKVLMFEQEWIKRKRNPSLLLLEGYLDFYRKVDGLVEHDTVDDLKINKTHGGWCKIG